MKCTFFGHADAYNINLTVLKECIEQLIGEGVNGFYVGNQGNFDRAVYDCLHQLRVKYPHIHISVVLAYLPENNQNQKASMDAIYPEGIEIGPPKFAIERRNKWMINASQYCICFITRKWGGAYKFARRAKCRGLTVINLGKVLL